MKKKNPSNLLKKRLEGKPRTENSNNYSQMLRNIAASFSQAVEHHNFGRYVEARVLYENILRVDSKHIPTLNCLGTLLLQDGQLEKGGELIKRSLALEANQPVMYMNLGTALKNRGRYEEALLSYDQAINFKSDFAEAYYNRGNTFFDLNRFEDALLDYNRAIALKPDYSVACFNRGNALRALNRLDEALASYDLAIAYRHDYGEAFHNRSYVLKDLNRINEALESCNSVIAIMPKFPDAYYNKGNALHGLHRFSEAVACYDIAITLKSDYVEAFCNRGNALKELGLLNEAIESYDRAIALKLDYAEAYNNKGNVLQICRRYDEAVLNYEKAMELAPALPYVAGSWLHCKLQCCDWEGIYSNFACMVSDIDQRKRVATPFFFLGVPSTPDHEKRCAEIYVIDKYPSVSREHNHLNRPKNDRIKVGYFSSDFCNHAMAYLIAELIELHDRSKFEIIAFSFSPASEDPIRKRLEKAFDSFNNVKDLADHEVARLARRLNIDIAVDLNGFTANSRVGIFASNPAPITVNHLGYPGTMGAGFIDYIIADEIVIPESHRRYYTERIVRLPDTYWFNDSTKIISDRLFTRSELELPEHGFVFCCFNNSYKITPDLFDIWMRILQSVTGSVLWLLEANPTVSKNLRYEALKRGVSSTRLVFAPRMNMADHLARHRHADLFLDTFYYNAHTTASDALWVGLPVLTCLGNTFAGRVAASLLNAIDLQEMITRTYSEYESRAIELATNPDLLAAVRKKLIINRTSQALFDTTRFTRHIEEAYTKMYERNQAGMPPDHLEIDGL